MAYDLALGPDGDLAIGPYGDIVLRDNAQRVAQQVAVTLSIIAGEYAFNTEFGLPLFSEDGQGQRLSSHLSSRSMSDNTRRSIIATAVTAVPGVSSLDSLSLDTDRATRRLSISMQLTTQYGALPLSLTV